MKELDALIKALEERNVIKSLKITVSMNPIPDEIPNKEEVMNDAIKACLSQYFAEDNHKDVRKLFINYAGELALNELVKALNIRPEESEKEAKDLLKDFMDALFN